MRDDHSHFVVLEGFEPSQTEPESGVLPLHHRTIFICVAKVIHFLEMASDISYFLFRFARFLVISRALFVLFGQRIVNYLKTVERQCLQVVTVFGWEDGFVNHDADFAWTDIECGARHHIVAAIDGDGHYWEAEVHCEFERPLLEWPHFSSVGTAAFGEHAKRYAFVQALLRIVHCFLQGFRVVGVHKNLSRHLASCAHEWDVDERTTHHPAEVMPQIARQGENIVCALVVCHKYVGFVFVDILASFHLHVNEK